MLMTVIADYLTDVKKCMELFKKKIGDKHPIKAWRDKTLSKSGQLSKNINYDFHGVGCCVEFPNYCVDFDFGKDGQSNGFDEWRIASYIDEKIFYYPYYKKKVYNYIDDNLLTYKIIDILEKEFQKYLDDGTFYKRDRLFYLSENIKKSDILERVEEFTLKKEIKKLLQHNLSELNFERIINNDNEYSIFIEKIINYIFHNEYDKLKELLSQNIIDNQKNIEKYTKYLFDLFFSIQNDNIKYIENREQKSIFWIYDSVLHQYNSLYNIRAIQKYKENLIIFFNIKKSDNASLGVVIDLEGKELFSIPFPVKEDSECINDDIIFYGSSIDLEKSTLEIVFTNGICWLEFWCRYDLENMKYIGSGLRK